jgi:WD40 repeat protein
MTPDGRLLVSTDRGVKAIDAETLRVIRRYPVGGTADAVSPDGRTAAIAAANGGLRLLDLASGRVRTLSGRGHLEARAFSPDGGTLSTAEDSGNVILWDVEEGVTTETLEGHAANNDEQHAFSPDGRTLYTAGNDGRVIVWDVAGDRRLWRPFPRGLGGWEPTEEAGRPAFAPSPDGRTLAVARLDGRVELIDAETLRRTASFEAFPGRAAVAIDYSADGRRLAVAGEGGGVGVWDVESREQLGALLRAPRGPRTANPRTVRALAFGRGDLLAAAEEGGAVRIWHVGRRELLRPPLRLPPSVLALAFSPDGSQLAIPFGADPNALNRGPEEVPSAEGPNGVEILDVGSGERVARLSPEGEVGSVAFSPDGSLLAGGEVEGGALLWATDGWRQVGGPLARRNASTLEVEFSPDGHTLAITHSDRSAALWDVASREPIGPILPNPPANAEDGGTVTARFTPDGAHLFVLYDPGGGAASNLWRGIRWEVDPELWLQRACKIAAGGLTSEQWAELVPEQDYVSACPSD